MTEESPVVDNERELIRMRMQGFSGISTNLERESRNPRTVDAIWQIQRRTQTVRSIQDLRELLTTLPPEYTTEINSIIHEVEKNLSSATTPTDERSEIEASLIRQRYFLIADVLARIRFSGYVNHRTIVDFCRSLFKIRGKKPDTFEGREVETGKSI